MKTLLLFLLVSVLFSCTPTEQYRMESQPENADHYMMTMLGDGALIHQRGDRVKARNRVWIVADSTLSLNGVPLTLGEFGEALKYVITNPDGLGHLPEARDSAVVFMVAGGLEEVSDDDDRIPFNRSVKRIFTNQVRSLYPEDYNAENLPWAERPSVRIAVHHGTPPVSTKLPPWSDGEPEIDELDSRNLFTVVVTKNNEVFVRDEKKEIADLTKLAKAFIANPDKSEDLAESPLKAVISLNNDRGTNYGVYLNVYNALKAAYDELWDEKAQELYGMPYGDDLPLEQRRAVKSAIPMIISEAEPRDL